MLRIDWPAIDADASVEAAPFQLLLCAVVTPHAQALHRPVHERVPITFVRRYVIDDSRWRHEATALAYAAYWMLSKLVRPPPLPTRCLVPAIPCGAHPRLHDPHLNFSTNNSFMRSVRRSIMTCRKIGLVETR